MKMHTSKLSIFLSLFLVFQLFNPLLTTLATGFVEIPKNFTVSLLNTNDISLKWDYVGGAERYRVYKIYGDKKELFAQTSSTSWNKLKADEGIYTLAVVAVKGGIESELSVPVEFEVIYPIIPSPENITSTISNVNDIQLKWTRVSIANSYRIYEINGDQRSLVASTSNTTRFINSLSEGEHIYEVVAVNDRFGESKNNNQIILSIDYPEILSPEGLTYTVSNVNDVLLKWKTVEHATSYKIYEVTNNMKTLISSTTGTSKYILGVTEGNHLYEVSAVSDKFGESKTNNQVELSIYFPIIKGPQGLNFVISNGNDLELKWQSVENASSYNVYQISNNEKTKIGTTTNKSIKVLNLPEGNYFYEVSTVSELFGESKENNKINVSIIYPELTAPSGLIASVEKGNNVYLKWQSAEFATSYNIYKVINGEKIHLSTTSGTSERFSGLDEGEHVYEVSSVSNRFGVSENNASTNVTVIYPTMRAPIAKIKNNYNVNAFIYWDEDSFATSFNIYQVRNGEMIFLKNVESNSYNTDNLSEGRHEYVITAFNEYFGESPLSNKVFVDIIPNLEAPTPDVPVVNGDEVKLEWSSVPGADSYNIYEVIDGELTLIGNTNDTKIVIEDLTPGSHEFQISPVSPAGVEGEKDSKIVVEVEQSDTTPPRTVANGTDEWQKGEYKVELTATDDKSGVAKTFYSVNGSEYVEGTSFTLTEDGLNTISFYSVDNAGNVEEIKTTEVKIDKTAPVTNSYIATNWNKGKVTVNLTATDDLSGVAKTFYSIDGSAYTEGNTFTISTEGITQVSFYSVDNAGNKEASKIEEVMIDNTAPVTKSDITDQWNKDAVNVNLTATDNLSGVAKTYYSISGSEYFEGTSFTVTGEGVIQVSFYSVDNAGNEEAVKTEFVKFDNQAPETVSDVTDKWNTGDVTVKLTATDNQSGVATTFYSINGSEFVEGTEFTVSQEGINKVSFYSVDNVGNVEVAKTVDVKVDKTAPSTVSDITDEWNQSQVAVKLTATDELSGVAKTYYSINGTDYVEGTQFTVSQESINKVSFYSVDNAGNIEEVQTVEVKVDKTAPVVSWDLANQLALGSTLPIAYKATDEHSGIAKETITVNGQVYENTDGVKLDKPGNYKVALTVTDHAGWTTIIEKTIEVYIPATLVVNPGVIKANAGDFTVKISLPKGIDTNLVDLSTATLNGVSAKSGTNGLVQQAKNGQFKFNRDDFEWKKGMVTVEFRVLVNGILVIGRTTVEVK
jgi:large repetitive protein